MSTTHLTLDEARRIIDQAFLPLHCTTVAGREDASFSLKVSDKSGRALCSIAHLARSQYSEPIRFAGLIEQARLELSKDGHALYPWSMPFQVDLKHC
ncbi:DUF1652 domain-containing protein [Pseudomonas kuykendallii]|uniref:DUF1652 domain-containing protein n=1 Tax=Pseudomonas kuykendallii TaxID=1007099 RepID=UPI0028D74D0D|nr:DUF1652 domain-containing protein [Pseudomonas kuykendallii]